MKAFLTLIVITLSLGTFLSLDLTAQALYYVPLYILAVYHIYRLNISEGFFLVFLEKTMKDEIARVRLGPTELEMKDEADKNEDKFLSLFDWKRSTVRKIISWSVFCATIYLLFFRLHLEITLEGVMPAIVALFLMRVVAVGHFLVPLAINLLLTLKDLPDYKPLEWVLFVIYGFLFVTNLALIYPSEERLGRKLSEWLSGKWTEVFRTAMILLVSFTAGLYLFPREFRKDEKPQVSTESIAKKEKDLRRLESSLRNMMNMGLMRSESLVQEARFLQRDMHQFSKEEERSPEEWKSLQERQEKLTKQFEGELSSAKSPNLTPELLDYMKRDLQSRRKEGIDPKTFAEMQKLLHRMENFKGAGGDEITADYRELKHGKNGFYHEGTELPADDHYPGTGSDKIMEMIEAEATKKDLTEKIEKNIEAMKADPDQGLQSVNDALKKELEKVDTTGPEERQMVTQELDRARAIQKELQSKASDPELAAKLEKLMDENRNLLNEMTPHMNAAAKSQLAKKVTEQRTATEAIRNEIRNDLAEKIYREEQAETKKELAEAEKKEDSKVFEKLLRMISILVSGILLFWFFSRMKKKGVKKVRGVPEDIREEIEEKLRAVKKKSLSPREEVIETYNVFHDSLGLLVFNYETPPSCIVYEGITAAEPELQVPVFTVTETFAKTFYGDRDVTTNDLRTFRKDVNKVFKFFDIGI